MVLGLYVGMGRLYPGSRIVGSWGVPRFTLTRVLLVPAVYKVGSCMYTLHSIRDVGDASSRVILLVSWYRSYTEAVSVGCI